MRSKHTAGAAAKGSRLGASVDKQAGCQRRGLPADISTSASTAPAGKLAPGSEITSSLQPLSDLSRLQAWDWRAVPPCPLPALWSHMNVPVALTIMAPACMPHHQYVTRSSCLQLSQH